MIGNQKAMDDNQNIDFSNKIIVDHAYKIYKRGNIDVVALRGMQCIFNRGQITVIMGPSGCGKTTLLNMIGGLDRLSSGKIYVNGADLTQLNDKQLEIYRRHNIGFVFQFSSLIPELNAIENIKLPLELAGNLNKEKNDYILELLNLIDLTDRKDHRPDELSGGEQQRIGVAAALANNPNIILCDEPTGELDTFTKLKIMELLRKIIEQYPDKTMIIVTHDPDMQKIADKFYYIRDGVISHEFTKEEMNQINSENTAEKSLLYSNTAKSTSKEDLLVELREISHYINKKIRKFENLKN